MEINVKSVTQPPPRPTRRPGNHNQTHKPMFIILFNNNLS